MGSKHRNTDEKTRKTGVFDILQIVLLVGVIGISGYMLLQLRGRNTAPEAVPQSTGISDNGSQRLDLMRQSLLGKKIDPLYAALEDLELGAAKNLIVFAYADHDCSTCIQKGVTLLEQIAIEEGPPPIVLFNVTGSKNPLSLENDKFVYLETDAVSQIVQELNNVQTPAMILFDQERRVQGFYVSTLYNDEPRRIQFMESLRAMRQGRVQW